MRRAALLLLLLGAVCFAGMPVRAQTPDELLTAASELFDAHKYAEAAQKLDTFLAANPKHDKAGAAAFVLGRCRSELKQYDKAIPAYEKAIATKDTGILTQSELGLGEAAIQTRQYDKAAKALEQATAATLKPEQAPIAWLWLGQADYELKRYDKAEDAYNTVIRQYPRSDVADTALYGLAMSALKQNNGAERARNRLRELVSRYPRSASRPQAELTIGQIDFEAKHYNEARGDYERILDEDSFRNATPEIRQAAEDGLIQTLLETGDYAAAIPRLESALNRLPATDPQRFRAEMSLGNCLYRQKQYNSSLNAYQEAAKSPEADVAAEGLYWAANADLGLNRPADAAVLFNRLVAKYPKSDLAAKAQRKAGDAFLAAKQSDAAATAFRAVVDHYPQSPEAAEARKSLSALVNSVTDPAQLAQALKNQPPAERARGTLRLARLYIDAKKYAESANALTDMLKLKPEAEVAAEGQYLLGLSYEAQDKTALAAPAYAEAVRLRSDAVWAADAQSRLAWLYIALKQPASAEKAANAALALKPEKAIEGPTRLALMQAHLDLQKWDAAIEDAKTILASNPPMEDIATALYTQAWVSEKLKKPDDALPLWERLSDEFPKSPYAAIALLHLGNAKLSDKKYDEAQARYAKLLSDYPKSPQVREAHHNLGFALYNQDKFAEAAAEFDAVVNDKDAGDLKPEALFWAGIAYEKADKKEEAIQRLTKFVTQYPKHEYYAKAKGRLDALKVQ
ncbi:MAG TPA: tetratricopeptide repeat protein [Chthonomonadaceae bacterium]|nr:tetratricopeptide repeat protein [Chthonomonadaceae bacterium]